MESLVMEVAEEGAQRPAHRLPHLRAPIPGVALDVAYHVILTELAQVIRASRAHLVQDRRMIGR